MQKIAPADRPDFTIAQGKIRVPDTPGMGVEFDPEFLKDAIVLVKIDQPAKGDSTGSGG